MIRRKDQEHLSVASAQGRTLYSFNVGDYHEIHTEWIAGWPGTFRYHLDPAEALLFLYCDAAPIRIRPKL